MKNKRIILSLLATSVFALFALIVLSCRKEITCITIPDREECKKKCKVTLFSKKGKYYYNDVTKECCCQQ